jgi:hypothetical protein
MTRWTALAIVAVTLGACANKPASEMPAAAAAPPAQTPQPQPMPMERHEASAQCWMKYDRAPGGLDAKSKLVDKCIADKMSGKP